MKRKVIPIDQPATAFYDEGTIVSMAPEIVDGILSLIHPNVDLSMRFSCIVDGNALAYIFNVNIVTNAGTLALKNKYKAAKDMLNKFESDEDRSIICDFYYNIYRHIREYCDDMDSYFGLCNLMFCWHHIYVKKLMGKISGSYAPLYAILRQYR